MGFEARGTRPRPSRSAGRRQIIERRSWRGSSDFRLLALRAVARVRPGGTLPAVNAEIEACARNLVLSGGGARGRRLAERLGARRRRARPSCGSRSRSPPTRSSRRTPCSSAAPTHATRRDAAALRRPWRTCRPQRVRALTLKIGPSHPLLRFALLEDRRTATRCPTLVAASRRAARCAAISPATTPWTTSSPPRAAWWACPTIRVTQPRRRAGEGASSSAPSPGRRRA